jgi:hypothetical protein
MDDPVWSLVHGNITKHLVDAILEMPHDAYHDGLIAAIMRAEDYREVDGTACVYRSAAKQ